MALTTGEMIGLGIGGLAIFYFISQKNATPTTTVIRTTAPTNTAAATTAAEITAGAGLVTSIVNDFTSD